MWRVRNIPATLSAGCLRAAAGQGFHLDTPACVQVRREQAAASHCGSCGDRGSGENGRNQEVQERQEQNGKEKMEILRQEQVKKGTQKRRKGTNSGEVARCQALQPLRVQGFVCRRAYSASRPGKRTPALLNMQASRCTPRWRRT